MCCIPHLIGRKKSSTVSKVNFSKRWASQSQRTARSLGPHPPEKGTNHLLLEPRHRHTDDPMTLRTKNSFKATSESSCRHVFGKARSDLAAGTVCFHSYLIPKLDWWTRVKNISCVSRYANKGILGNQCKNSISCLKRCVLSPQTGQWEGLNVTLISALGP